jgi:hypothetical protein
MYLAVIQYNHPPSLDLQLHCKKSRHQVLQKTFETPEDIRKFLVFLFRQNVLQLTYPMKTGLYQGEDQAKQHQLATTEQLSS